MAAEQQSQFSPSWMASLSNDGTDGGDHQVRAFSRLWRLFMRTRVFIAAMLLALEVFVVATRAGGPAWLVLVCAVHLSAALAVLMWLQPADPLRRRLSWHLSLIHI